MGSKSKHSINKPIRKTRRRTNSHKGFCSRPSSSSSNNKKNSRTVINGGGGGSVQLSRSSCYSVTDKLEALKNLIPSHNRGDNDIVKSDQLFQETADYIVLLKTQVFILQNLVDFYGSLGQEDQNAVQ